MVITITYSNKEYQKRFSKVKVDFTDNISAQKYFGYKKAYEISWLWFEIEIIIE